MSTTLRNIGALLALLVTGVAEISLGAAALPQVQWRHISSASGDLPVPPANDGQTGLRVVDLDKNGQTDYVMTFIDAAAIVWYRHIGNSFVPYVIEPQQLYLTHGERFEDIDGDGDLDLMFGQSYTDNGIYWWENPYPNYSPNTPWVRRTVRDTGGFFYHDNIWADFNGDGVKDFVSWNQGSLQLLLFKKPTDPRNSGPWPAVPIFTWSQSGELYDYRGVDAIDVNLDGKLDLVGGGGWFEHTGGDNYTYHLINDAMRGARHVAGQLIPGGRPEIVCVLEKPAHVTYTSSTPLLMFQWDGSSWQTRTLLSNLYWSHTLQLGDVNQDGFLDIVTGELASLAGPPEPNSDARTVVLYGDGTGNFQQQIIWEGQETLEGMLADIDNDGDLDFIGPAYRHHIPRIDMWINEGVPLSLTINVVGNGSVSKYPDQTTYSAGQVVQLTALPAAGWSFAGWSGNLSGSANPASLTMSGNRTVTATFNNTTPPTDPIVSDDFSSGTIDPGVWTFVNPLGDGHVSVSNKTLRIQVPAGVDHDIWTGGNRAPRLMQSVSDTDFEMEGKFESAVSKPDELEGLLVEQDAGNFIRFDVVFTSSSVRLFAASFAGGAPTVQVNTPITSGSTYYLRIKRQGNLWTCAYSYDGSNWSIGASFVRALAVLKVGVFAGNGGANPPAFTGIVDYVFNTASPIVPEDGPSGGSITVNVIGSGSVTKNPEQASYAGGQVVQLSAVPAAGWSFLGWSGDVSGAANPTSLTVSGNRTVTATFNNTMPPTNPIVSEDFSSGSIDPSVWTFVNPLGDGHVSVSNKTLRIQVPAGVEHDIWTGGNRAPRLMQSVSDTDFEMEGKFESAVSQPDELQGLLVEQDAGNFIRFDIVFTGSSVRIFAASFASGSPTVHVNTAITAGTTYYLRVKRQGSQWTCSYSYDGNTWTVGANFARALAVLKVGVFAGTAGANPPAFTGIIDYFFNRASPIVPEDGPPGGSVTVNVVGSGSVSKNPDQASYTGGQMVQLTAMPAAGWSFSGWSSDVSGTANPTSLTVSGNRTVTATFNNTMPPTNPIVSEDFSSGGIDPNVWTFVNPLGDGHLSVSNKTLRIQVPAGVDHDIWTGGNRAPRLMQSVSDTDFEMEGKFESAVSQPDELQGLLVEQDAGNFIRFDIVFTGSSVRIFAASFASGSPTVHVNTAITAGATYYLRLKRQGNQWTCSYSYDGNTWTVGANFVRALALLKVGVFAGNGGANPPAFTGIVDYVFNTASPIVPEDGPSGGSVTVNVAGSGSVSKNPDQASYTGGQMVQLTAMPSAGWIFTGWSGDVSGTANPTSVTLSGNRTVTATFMRVSVPPSIGQPPTSLVVTQGTSATFNVVAGGDAPLSYQWLFNGGTIGGATSSSLQVVGVQSQQAGNYQVVVSNPYGAVTSAVAILAVAGARMSPLIIQPPASLVVTQGSSATFSVVAGGDEPLSYQWWFNGYVSAGDTNTSFQIVSTQPQHAGLYQVIVKNPYGTMASIMATLTVLSPPSISQPPASLVVTQGSSATFNVIASGQAPLSYQWWFNDNYIADATNDTCTITNVQETDAGAYWVAVTNSAGNAISAPADLIVLVPPSITEPPVSSTNFVGGTALFSLSASGTSPLSYQWKKDNVELVDGPNLAGTFTATLTVSDLSFAEAGAYSVIVSNAAGVVFTAEAILTIVCPSMSFDPETLPKGRVDVVYHQTISASGGAAPYSYDLTDGALPSDLALGSDGTLTGTATAAGAFNFTVTATDLTGCQASHDYALNIVGPPVIETIAWSEGIITVTWQAIPGETYRMQYKDDFNEIDWHDLLPEVRAADVSASKTDEVGTTPRFYRVVLVE